MRARVEAGRFEMAAYLGKGPACLVGDVNGAPIDRAIDVEHTEADSLHVKGADRHGKRRALVDECGRGPCRWLCLHVRDEDLETVFRGLSVVDACGHKIQNNCQRPVASFRPQAAPGSEENSSQA